MHHLRILKTYLCKVNISENTNSVKAPAFLKCAPPTLLWGTFAVLLFAVVLSSCGLRKSVEVSLGLEISKPYQPSKTTAAHHIACSAVAITTNAAKTPSALRITPDNHSFEMPGVAYIGLLHSAAVPPFAFAERPEFGSKIQLFILYKRLKRAL